MQRRDASSASQVNFFTEIFPKNVLAEIFYYLSSAEEVVILSSVSKLFRSVFKERKFFEHVFQRYFSESEYIKMVDKQKRVTDQFLRLKLTKGFPDFLRKISNEKDIVMDGHKQFVRQYKKTTPEDFHRNQMLLFLKKGDIDEFEKRIIKIEKIKITKKIDLLNFLFYNDSNDPDVFFSEIEKIDCVVSLNYLYSCIKEDYSVKGKINILKFDSRGSGLVDWAIIFKQPLELITELLDHMTRVSLSNVFYKNYRNYSLIGALSIQAAVYLNRLDIVKLLIQRKPDLLNKRGDCEKTPLMMAVERGRQNIVEFLLEQPGIELDARMNIKAQNRKDYRFNWTVLHFAVYRGNIDIFEKLLKASHFSGFEALDKSIQQKLIDIAAYEGHLEFIKKFVQFSSSFKSLLEIAIRESHEHIVDFLLQQSDVDLKMQNQNKQHENGWVELLLLAIKLKKIEMIILLIQAGAIKKFDCFQEERLMLDAVMSEYWDIVSILIEGKLKDQPGVQIWTKINEIKEDPMMEDDIEEVEDDIENNRKKWTVLHYVVNSQAVEAIKAILRYIVRCDDFPENLIPIDCSQLDKMTGSAIVLLQFIVREAKKEMVALRSPSLFSDHKRQAIIGQQTQTNIQAAKTLMDLIIHGHDANSYQNKLAEIKDTLNNNAELKIIYDELGEVDSNFKFFPPQLMLN